MIYDIATSRKDHRDDPAEGCGEQAAHSAPQVHCPPTWQPTSPPFGILANSRSVGEHRPHHPLSDQHFTQPPQGDRRLGTALWSAHRSCFSCVVLAYPYNSYHLSYMFLPLSACRLYSVLFVVALWPVANFQTKVLRSEIR